ncbi:MAG: hypothetical protein NVS3B3_07450 [Aquirhabdus sp.]
MVIKKERSIWFHLLAESESLLHKKWEDHRALSSLMFIVAAFLGTLEWTADYATDPDGAQHTIGLRLTFLSLLAFPFALKYIKNRRVIEFASVSAGLIGIVNYIEILNRLHMGMIYGFGGFTMFLFIPLLIAQGFSLRVNLFATVLYAIFPTFWDALGFVRDFDSLHYATLIVPTAITTILAHCAFAHNYRLRYESEFALQCSSNNDPLTELYNRRYFEPLLKQEMFRANRFIHPVSLLMLDIDHFKNINDTYGHPTGDLVIKTIANICRNSARNIDTPARIGGEEFAILLLEVNLEGALLAAERIRKAVENTTIRSLKGAPLSFTISIGVAERPLNVLSEKDFIAMADAALYQAKAAGRNCVKSMAQPISYLRKQ